MQRAARLWMGGGLDDELASLHRGSYDVGVGRTAVGSNTVPRGTLEVVEYVPRQATKDAVPPDQPRGSEDLWSRLRLEHRTLTRCAAALAAIGLHLLFVAPVLWDGGAPEHSRERSYHGDAALQWVTLEDSTAMHAVRPQALGPPALTSIAVTAEPKLPAGGLPAVSEARGDPAADPAGFGALYGRYVGQIRARIDRAWQRPRTVIGAPIFQCQAQVDQDGAGRVREVTLVECNGDARWQLSLVHAIEAASPLPAPPSAAVFTHHVLLAFRATAYSPGAPAGLYEPPGALPASYEAQQDEKRSRKAFQMLREAARAPHSHRVIELRIEGSSAEVEPQQQ